MSFVFPLSAAPTESLLLNQPGQEAVGLSKIRSRQMLKRNHQLEQNYAVALTRSLHELAGGCELAGGVAAVSSCTSKDFTKSTVSL